MAARESDQAAALAWGSKVHDKRCVPGKLGGHGQVERQGRLPTPPFFETMTICQHVPMMPC